MKIEELAKVVSDAESEWKLPRHYGLTRPEYIARAVAVKVCAEIEADLRKRSKVCAEYAVMHSKETLPQSKTGEAVHKALSEAFKERADSIRSLSESLK